MSTKSVAEKLRIPHDATLWTSHPDRLDVLGPLADGNRVVGEPGAAAAAVVFADDAASLREIAATHGDDLHGPKVLWVGYPKGNRTDINRDTVWPVLAEHGLRPIGQVAIDDVWSAMRFRPLEPGETFKGATNSARAAAS